MPRLLMTVVAAGRNELIQNGGQVMLQSWLELNLPIAAVLPTTRNTVVLLDAKRPHRATTIQ